MGIFDLGFDAPDASGWETRVTPGTADANNLSLAERIRAQLTGSTNPNPQAASLGNAAGKMLGAASGGPPKPPQQQAAAAAPAVPAKPGIDPALLAKLQAPFAKAGPGGAGAPRPPSSIYAPFAGTGPVG